MVATKFRVWDVETGELPHHANHRQSLETRMSKFADPSQSVGGSAKGKGKGKGGGERKDGGKRDPLESFQSAWSIDGLGSNHGQDVRLLRGEAFHENGFLQALDIAYNYHQGLVLRPDDIWLLVTMGLSEHINKEPEKYRQYFVDFEGQMEIAIQRDCLVPGGGVANDWLGAGVFEEFAGEIKGFIGDTMHDALVADFSTTTPLDLAVSQMVLMNAMQQYFSYVVMGRCGIPFISLEGTIEDWETMRQRLEVFAPFGPDDWLEDMRGILDEFVAAKGGDVRVEFWQRIYCGKHQEEEYFRSPATTWVSGWVHAFFPYLSQGSSNAVKNKVAAACRQKKGYSTDPDCRGCTSCGIVGEGSEALGQWWCKRCWRLWDLKRFYNHYRNHEDMPTSFRSTPFKWEWCDAMFDCDFVAGFVGCSSCQEQTEVEQQWAVRPQVGFCVLNKGKAT